MQAMKQGVLAIGLCAGGVLAQQEAANIENGWALIGDLGNRNAFVEEMPFAVTIQIGAVDYLYRISTLEVTLGEYFEFVQAYAPIYFKNNPDLSRADVSFTGWNIIVNRHLAVITGGNPDRAANMGWEYAARYVNWLHHGKLNDEWAFETGVFDTSTFEEIDGVPWEPQEVHSPAARYWIPTEHEWTKAAYWDPNKLGDGIGGYWRYPNGTDFALPVNVQPEDGGVRNAGYLEFGFPFSVGFFPDTRSPWGLMDLSGGEWEWAERYISGRIHERVFVGSVWFDTLYNEPYTMGISDFDRLGYLGETGVVVPHGLRLASTPFSPVDLNQDGFVDISDVYLFITQYVAGDLQADLRFDGQLDSDDVRVFLGLWANTNL